VLRFTEEIAPTLVPSRRPADLQEKIWKSTVFRGPTAADAACEVAATTQWSEAALAELHRRQADCPAQTA